LERIHPLDNLGAALAARGQVNLELVQKIETSDGKVQKRHAVGPQ
jgi:hypothetical protein